MIMALVACGHYVGSARQRSPGTTRPRRKLKSPADSAGRERTNSSDPALPADTTSGSLFRRPCARRGNAAEDRLLRPLSRAVLTIGTSAGVGCVKRWLSAAGVTYWRLTVPRTLAGRSAGSSRHARERTDFRNTAHPETCAPQTRPSGTHDQGAGEPRAERQPAPAPPTCGSHARPEPRVVPASRPPQSPRTWPISTFALGSVPFPRGQHTAGGQE